MANAVAVVFGKVAVALSISRNVCMSVHRDSRPLSKYRAAYPALCSLPLNIPFVSVSGSSQAFFVTLS